jgi:hypothetical protein
MHDPRSPLRTRARARLATLLAALSLVLVACGGNAPSAAPSPTPSHEPTAAPSASAPASPAASADQAAIYDAIEAQVIELRGLQPTKPVERQVISEAELRTILTKQFDEETPPAYLAANERLYKALGLMPQDESLRDLSLDLLSGGVAGFYRNDQGKLYIVSKTGRIGGNEKITFAHEFDHSLQDQTWPVFKDQDGVLDRSDWIIGRQAVYEGDATLLMSLWAVANLTPQELQDVLAAGSDPATAALMERIPAIMKETLLFPYTTGAAFVQAAQVQGGWAGVDKLYDRLPESSEQILHPEKYTANEAPLKVDLPADLAKRLGAGWSVPLEDTFGELQTGIWLREGGVAVAAATDAAAGWGGDRLAVIEGPNGAWAVALHTVWDTQQDAAAFETAATTALSTAGGVTSVLPGTGGTTRWILVASDADSMGRVANVLGLAG